MENVNSCRWYALGFWLIWVELSIVERWNLWMLLLNSTSWIISWINDNLKPMPRAWRIQIKSCLVDWVGDMGSKSAYTMACYILDCISHPCVLCDCFRLLLWGILFAVMGIKDSYNYPSSPLLLKWCKRDGLNTSTGKRRGNMLPIKIYLGHCLMLL